MSRRSSERQSKESINYEMLTNKKQTPYEDLSSDVNNTGYGIIPSTERKRQIYELASTIHLDQKTTPLKYESKQLKYQTAIKESKDHSKSSLDAIKYRQTLQRLDQTEQKLVLSDKKYGQLWRKYQAACESIKSLNKQLSRAQEKPFDLQVKCNLLEKERDELKQKLRLRSAERQKANESLGHTSGLVHKLEEQLQEAQETIRKLNQENSLKTQTISRLQEELNLGKESQNRSYQRIISTLKQQIQLLHSELTLKTQEVSSLSHNIYSNNFAQKHESSSSATVSHLHLELSKLHKEKLNIVASYEQKLSNLEQNYKFDTQRLKNELKQLSQKLLGIELQNQVKIEEKVNETMDQMKKLKENNEYLRKDNDQLANKVDNLQLAKQYLENQVSHFANQNQKARIELTESQRDRQEIKLLYHELQSIKKEFSLVKQELAQKESLIIEGNIQKEQLVKEIQRLELEIKAYQNLQIEYDKRVKSANDLMLDKMLSVEAEREQMQRELLAERLETIKLKQELDEQKVSLKREYQLSLANVKGELSQKIVSIREQKNSETIEKEKIYAQMKDLERKYELLASEMLTVNDMMSIATKVHKRHSNFVKK